MYELVKIREDETVHCTSHKSLKIVSRRLSHVKRGWIQKINSDMTKTVVKARGFSRQAMESIKSCGVETC